VCGAVISRDNDQSYGFLERVTDAFIGFGSRRGGDGHLVLTVIISESKKLNYKNYRFISRRGHGYLSVCHLSELTVSR